MDVDDLFLATGDDLAGRVTGAVSEYEVLMSATLLRKLLLDGAGSLVDQVNRERRMRLRFRTSGISRYAEQVLNMKPAFWALGDGLDPSTRLTAGTANVNGRYALRPGQETALE